MNEQVVLLNYITLNIFSNFAPNKICTFDRRGNQWMTEYLVYNKCKKSSKSQTNYIIIQQAILEVLELAGGGKRNYYDKVANKLTEHSTSSKIYLYILTAFCNIKRIPLIPPICIKGKYSSNIVSNIVQIRKKRSKQITHNFRPISFSPTCEENP